MARPRTPSNVLNLRGSFKRNPKRARARANEPHDERAIGKPPRGLTKEVRAAWRELVEASIPGVLRYSDRPAVLAAAQLYARMKNQRGGLERTRDQLLDEIESADLRNPDILRGLFGEVVAFVDQASPWRPADQANLTRLLTQMGMTPADRSRIVVPREGDDDNPFADF